MENVITLTIITILTSTLMYATPYIFGALGGVISEKSGVVNIGIEGMMTIGAFAGATVAYFTGNPWIGFFAGGIAGCVLSLLHAIASVSFKADQTISGIALNFIGPGVALFLSRVFFHGSTTTATIKNKLPKLFGGMLEKYHISLESTFVLALIIMLMMVFILNKTRSGLRIKAVGEHPAAADTLGVKVSRTRYTCVLASGFLAGLGGASMTLSVVSSFGPATISGQGFIALAAVIFGKWKPFYAFLACLFFGFTKAIATIPPLRLPAIPNEFLAMLPYVVTLLVLMLFVGKSIAPKADGVPYIKGES